MSLVFDPSFFLSATLRVVLGYALVGFSIALMAYASFEMIRKHRAVSKA
jgi:hypothetical protein